MAIVYEELSWQSQRVVNSDIEFTNTSNTKNNVSGINDNNNIIIKEKHPIRKGLNLIRESTYVTEPLNYLPFHTDYIGVCFVFADSTVDKSDLAFKDIYHDKLNITNGFEYKNETLLAVHKPLYYVGLQFDPAFIESLNEHQPLPDWLMQLTTQKNGQILDHIDVPPAARQLAWQLCQLPVTSYQLPVTSYQSAYGYIAY